MMSYYKLVEMNNNGVSLRIDNAYTSKQKSGQGKQWDVTAAKSSDGVLLSIQHTCDDLDEGIDEIYQKWCKATGQGIPEHKLNILEHHQTKLPEGASKTGEGEDEEEPLSRSSFDDEIPF